MGKHKDRHDQEKQSRQPDSFWNGYPDWTDNKKVGNITSDDCLAKRQAAKDRQKADDQHYSRIFPGMSIERQANL